MKHSVADEQIREQLALYALGALSQQEARVVEHHLAEDCEVCASELRQFESVVEVLGFTVLPAMPPEGVREKLISGLAKKTQSVSPSLSASLKTTACEQTRGEWTRLRPACLKNTSSDEGRGTVTTLIRMMPGIKLQSSPPGTRRVSRNRR